MAKKTRQISQKENSKILNTLNDTQVDYPKDKTIVNLFEEQVKKSPEAKAIKFKDKEFTFKELNEKANQLAHYLLDTYHIKPDDLLGIELDRSEWMVIGIFAIIKTGGAYVPIDPHYPEQRKAFIKRDASLKVILDDAELVNFNKAQNENAYLTTNPKVQLTPSNLIYVIYTSGSTGNPKGCMLEHRGLVNRLTWMQKSYSLSEKDCVLQKTTFTFDVSVWELIWWSLNGASVSILEPGAESQPDKIISTIAETGVTILHFVPSMLSVFLEYLERNKKELQRFKSLRQVYASGEALQANQVKKFRELLPEVKLMNLYGPTEASIDVSYYLCNNQEEVNIPIGKPIDNTELHLLDTGTQHLVSFGSIGEIYIGGAGLARG